MPPRDGFGQILRWLIHTGLNTLLAIIEPTSGWGMLCTRFGWIRALAWAKSNLESAILNVFHGPERVECPQANRDRPNRLVF
jgi:hypothetical protein